MKKETKANRLIELLDLQDKVANPYQTKPRKPKPVPEDEVQEFREAQGYLYFFQAPELFTRRQCKNCGDGFFVSRQLVSYCSYACIKEALNNMGLEWRRGKDIYTIIQESYDGNEPIWIRNLDKLKTILTELLDSLNHKPSKAPVSETSNKPDVCQPSLELVPSVPGQLELTFNEEPQILTVRL